MRRNDWQPTRDRKDIAQTPNLKEIEGDIDMAVQQSLQRDEALLYLLGDSQVDRRRRGGGVGGWLVLLLASLGPVE